MKIKSRFDMDDTDTTGARLQYMHGGCGAPYNLGMGPGRLDAGALHIPRLFRWIFDALGWKTHPRSPSTCEK